MPEIVEREGWRVRFRGEVSAEEVEGAYRLRLAEYKKRVRVPGFRPGRVPDRVLEARIGREVLLAEVRGADRAPPSGGGAQARTRASSGAPS